jgi:hypothetical protein
VIRVRLAGVVVAIAVVGLSIPLAYAESPDWVVIEYGEIVDRREPTHSGEPVGVLLDRLDGRSIPEPGEREGDRLAHTLLDAPMERYAFVLPDALDALRGASARPFVELAWRWAEGERQPAWVELLRARRYVVDSDGSGHVRVFAPLDGPQENDVSLAARLAWERGRSVLRQALRSVRRLEAPEGRLDVEIYPWVHRPERTSFLLGTRPYRVELDPSDDFASPLAFDPTTWTEFLES